MNDNDEGKVTGVPPDDLGAPTLTNALEFAQLVASTAQPLPRRHLTLRVRIGLWTLRAIVSALTGLVVFVFIRHM